MTMNRRDQLSNAIYQRMKQLQARLNRRNAEEQRRQEKAEKAKNILWEEHQRQLLQFENYLKRITPCSRRRPRTCRTPHTPNNTECRTPVEQEDIVLKERATAGSRSTLTSPISSFEQTNSLARTTSTVIIPDSAPTHSTRANSYRSSNWHSSSHPTSPGGYHEGKSELARGLENLDWQAGGCGSAVHSQYSNNVSSNDMSPPPTLPSTPSQCSLIQTPTPHVETPVINFEMETTQVQPVLPDISVTKLTVTTPEIETKQEVPPPKKPKKKPTKPKKKKLTRKHASSELLNANTPSPDKKNDPKISKKEAQQQIKAIFKNANSIPEEELTEEAFTVFLDTIKQLSEYVDQDEVNSQNFEVIDGISSGFSSRVMELGDELSSERTQSPAKTCGTPASPSATFRSPTPKTMGSTMQVKKAQAEERRRQRILVVKEKQAGIIRYRKVTMAELRLRRQRALMRVRSKLQDDMRERNHQEMQRMRLFELASLNEKDRLARLAQYKLDEEEKAAEDEELKRLKELKVKAELEQLLERSRRRQMEEGQMGKRNRECEDIEEKGDEDDYSEAKQPRKQEAFEVAKRVSKKWKSAARRARNRELYDQMIRKNSSNLYRNLVKELIMQTQAELITQIPGFSYFLLLKYTLDPEEVEEIMMDM